MIKAEPTITLPPRQQQALQRAVKNLENPDFAARPMPRKLTRPKLDSGVQNAAMLGVCP